VSRIPENQAPFSVSEVLAATSGRASDGLDPALRFRGVGTDTRADLTGKLFVALAGDRYDAHEYLDQAAAAGASAALVERAVSKATLPLVQVTSTLAALGDLARFHRRRFAGKLVAIGGSAGKTTTRSAVGAALEVAAPGAVHQTSGNLNNLIGVPLVLLGLASTHRFAVVEVGTNTPGEVARLMEIVEPDASLLTLIDVEHTEGLGDLDGVEREEGDLFARLPPNGIAIGNVDDARVARQLAAARAARRVGYGLGGSGDVRAVERAGRGLAGQTLRVAMPSGEIRLEVPLLGDAGALAALAALSVLGLFAPEALTDAGALTRALGKAGEPGRLRPLELSDGSVVLDDTYNANPASVLASIGAARELSEARGSRLFLVLGEMRELGRASRQEHERVGRALEASGAAELVAIAGDAKLYVEGARAAGIDAVFSEDSVNALALVRERVRPGDVILVKASRGVRAERVVEGLVGGGSTRT
jgi:UDP-N-acetylmuramoyl-tripeptide--D-alanyl-D-alanine ligase